MCLLLICSLFSINLWYKMVMSYSLFIKCDFAQNIIIHLPPNTIEYIYYRRIHTWLKLLRFIIIVYWCVPYAVIAKYLVVYWNLIVSLGFFFHHFVTFWSKIYGLMNMVCGGYENKLSSFNEESLLWASCNFSSTISNRKFNMGKGWRYMIRMTMHKHMNSANFSKLHSKRSEKIVEICAKWSKYFVLQSILYACEVHCEQSMESTWKKNTWFYVVRKFQWKIINMQSVSSSLCHIILFFYLLC